MNIIANKQFELANLSWNINRGGPVGPLLFLVITHSHSSTILPQN